VKLCDDGHGEVAYDSMSCPACQLLEDIKSRDEDVKVLERSLADSDAIRERLEDELESLRAVAGVSETIQPRRPRLVEETTR